MYQIKDLAQVKEVPQGQVGFVKSDGKSALTLAIVKQADASCVLSSLSHPVESYPACQSLSLWERWHCEAMTERATVNLWKMHE